MISFFRHYWIRLRAVCTDPFALAGLLLTGFASLMYWPGVVSEDTLAQPILPEDYGINEIVLMLLWIYILPMMAGYLAGGSVAATGREALAMRAMPALPLRPRTRVLAESAVILTFLFLVRIPSFILGEEVHQNLYLPGLMDAGAATAQAFRERSLVGSCIMLPSILIWVAPSRSVHFYFMVRPLLLVAGYLAALYLGWMSSALSCVLVGAAFSAIIFLLLGRELPTLPFGRAPKGTPRLRHRPCMNPETRLWKDFLYRPLPGLVILLVIQGFLLLLDGMGVFPRLGFYAASSLVFGFMFSFIALRPLGFFPGEMETWGRSDRTSQEGSGHPSWSYLPVRREAVTRGVFLHGLISGTFIWAAVIFTNLLSSRFSTGQWRMIDMDGGVAGRLLLPYIALVPCLASALTCMSVRNGTRTMISAGAGFAVMVGNLILLANKAPVPVHFGVLALAAWVGCLPCLPYLRGPRSIPESGS